MNWEPWIAVGVITAVFVALQVRRGAPVDVLFLSGLVLVTLTGVITPEEAVSGFANPAVLTIGGLLVVAAGLRVTGVLDWIGRWLLGAARSERAALGRLAPALVAASAFLLNTALVAMMMPVILDWCRRLHFSPSRLLLPLSYLAILGGVCTTIGTSTTLVVQGKLQDLQAEQIAATEGDVELAARADKFVQQLRPLGLFEIGRVGLPCALAGAALLWLVGFRLLPNQSDLLEQLGEHRREYLVELAVQTTCPLVGQTVEQAGLRSLPGLFLIEIDRGGEVLTPVSPSDVLHAADRLVFTGVVSTIVDLEKIPGLVPAADVNYEVQPTKRARRRWTEVVLSRTSPLIGVTVKQANFRQRYNAAVVAVHRNGVRLTNKIGNISLEPGDTLLLQTRDDFVKTFRNHRDFYLVSGVDDAEPRRHHKTATAAALAAGLIAWLVVASLFAGSVGVWDGWRSPGVAALTIAVLMVLTRCLRASEARSAIDLHMLVTIAAALGLGKALTESGAAAGVAEALVGWVGDRPWVLLAVVYLLAVLFTETITNNAVAAMLLPLAVAVAWQGGYSPRPFVIAITLASSLSFVTPIGYQTNLMVMGPGGYRPFDYIRCGGPLALLVTAIALSLIPWIWPFS
ncbi:MAG: SLC13 family permease [Pirellulaceae bacterium]|nr:SLC13 family permease [Pirellulaceae bacterium]